MGYGPESRPIAPLNGNKPNPTTLSPLLINDLSLITVFVFFMVHSLCLSSAFLSFLFLIMNGMNNLMKKEGKERGRACVSLPFFLLTLLEVLLGGLADRRVG